MEDFIREICSEQETLIHFVLSSRETKSSIVVSHALHDARLDSSLSRV